jgi:hypothetical protein
MIDKFILFIYIYKGKKKKNISRYITVKNSSYTCIVKLFLLVFIIIIKDK